MKADAEPKQTEDASKAAAPVEDRKTKSATPATPTPTPTENEGLSAGSIEFPAIPTIVIPPVIGISSAQRALEASIEGILDPIAGITIKPARCEADGALVSDAGITSIDDKGTLTRVSDKGTFEIAADGSGEAIVDGAIITVNADGSGSIVDSGGDDDERGATIEVNADGSGSYTGPYGVIELDGKGGGSWTSDKGTIEVNADGSGEWIGPLGTIEINADGSGSWVGGPLEIVENDGKGNGSVGAPPKEMKMAPIPKVQPAGKFPLLTKFEAPGAPCGYVISLSDSVLFDFDKSDLRPEAKAVLDTLAKALGDVEAKSIEVGGHTDAKGSDEYNLGLSERRAQSVLEALRSRGVAKDANAKGYGESKPLAPNELAGRDNPSGRQLNRRVEIFIRT